jgi:hypothetical protein
MTGARTPDREALDVHAARQLGLFTRDQARDCGFSPGQINRRRHEGDWVDVRRHVLAERGLRLTPKVRDLATQLVLPEAVLAGPSAARWHDITVPNPNTFVVLDKQVNKRPRDVIVFRETLPEQDVRVVDAGSPVRITSLDRTVFDCMRVLPDVAALSLLSQALELGWTSLAQLGGRVGRFTTRHGAPRLVRLLRGAAQHSQTSSEKLCRRLLQRAGIYGWLVGEPITDRWGLVCVGDIVFMGPKLMIDLDRKDTGTPLAAQHAEERRNRLLASGWRVLHFNWYELSTQPDQVVYKIRDTLDQLGVHTQ